MSFSTLLEAYTLVLHRLGLRTARTWLAEVLIGTTSLNPTPEDYGEAAARIQAYSDQPLTLFDTVLAVLSERLGLPVWTYDHHFDIMRAPVWR